MKAFVHIVDDEPKLLKIVGIALETSGYEVDVSTNGANALKKIAARVPDLIILDVMMPGMDGFEVCQKLRSDPKTANTPIIFLSALAQVEDKITGLKAGADEYLTKPIDTRELVVRVEAILSRMESLRSTIDVVEAETLVFMGVKGGVGTTTVALNIACALCRKDQNILAVELRSYYGSFTHHLALAFSGHWGEILEGSSGGINERDLTANIAKHPSGLALLNSPPVHLKEGFEQEHLSALLTRLVRDWDYIVLDLPSHPSDVHQPALEVADFLFLILEPAPDSLSAGKQTLDYLHSLKAGIANVGCIVVNRASLASAVTAGEIEAELGVPVIRAIPQAIDSLIASHKAGLPLVRAQPEHHASMAFKEIATMVVDKSLATSVSRT